MTNAEKGMYLYVTRLYPKLTDAQVMACVEKYFNKCADEDEVREMLEKLYLESLQ